MLAREGVLIAVVVDLRIGAQALPHSAWRFLTLQRHTSQVVVGALHSLSKDQAAGDKGYMQLPRHLL